jgi:hypothetical protein
MTATAPYHLLHHPAAEEPRDAAVMRRIRTVIDNVELDCECRARLDEALGRFAALEQQRTMRQHLALARQHRERIKAILDFLQEVDHLMINEPDRSVYAELALLFEEVSVIATEGAAAMHRLAALGADREDGDS